MTDNVSGSGGFRGGLVTSSQDVDPQASILFNSHYLTRPVTLDASQYTADGNGDKIVVAGQALGEISASDKVANYDQTTGATAETVSLAITGSPTGGTFALRVGGDTTDPIAHNATAAAVAAALNALPAVVAAGGVTASGGPLPDTPVVITWVTVGNAPNIIEVDAEENLTGGSTPDATATITAGTASTVTDGRGTGIGVLAHSVNLRYGNVVAAMIYDGDLLEARCTGVDAAFKADLAGSIRWH